MRHTILSPAFRSALAGNAALLMDRPRIGIDFGTTNSSVARAMGGQVELVRFADGSPSFRSLLYLERTSKALRASTGPAAIERYLQVHEQGERPGRLIQSLKSYLPVRSLTGTEVFGRHHTLEDLISRILSDLRLEAERAFGCEVRSATVGRPVRFVGADTAEDEAFALERLRGALMRAGFTDVEFQMEPLAAAWSYAATLTGKETVLIGDFGGGTSDFSLVRLGSGGAREVLATAGLPFAGDAFDARLVRRLVAPALGSESLARSLGKSLPALPAWIYNNLERWHTLSFLRTRSVLEMMAAAEKRAFEPEKIAALRALVEEDLGYQLHRAVSRVKTALSREDAAEFVFAGDEAGSLELRASVTRREFEGWIAPELQGIAETVDRLVGTAGVEVDRVFLTGGTSFVPAVRGIFEERFPGRVTAGDEFTSVAQGLALAASERA